MAKFSILKSIDLDILNKRIMEFINDTNEYNPYIFMNTKTASDIAYTVPIDDGWHSDMFKKLDKKNMCGMYQGYPIYINDKLEYGEVEIR